MSSATNPGYMDSIRTIANSSQYDTFTPDGADAGTAVGPPSFTPDGADAGTAVGPPSFTPDGADAGTAVGPPSSWQTTNDISSNTKANTPAGDPDPGRKSNSSSSGTNSNSNSKTRIWHTLQKEKAFISTVSISIISFFLILPLFFGMEFVANPANFLMEHLASKEFINNQFATAISIAISTSLIPPIIYLSYKAIALRRQYRTSLKQILEKKLTDGSSQNDKSIQETGKSDFS